MRAPISKEGKKTLLTKLDSGTVVEVCVSYKFRRRSSILRNFSGDKYYVVYDITSINVTGSHDLSDEEVEVLKQKVRDEMAEMVEDYNYSKEEEDFYRLMKKTWMRV